jgi:TP901 family phage tail tape measure protein
MAETPGTGALTAGTAFVDIKPNLSGMETALSSFFGGSKFGKYGKVAGVALGAGLAAAGIGKALYEIGEQFDDAFDKIQVQTGATGKAMKGLENDFKGVLKSVPTDFDSAAAAVGGLNQRLDITGKPLRTLSRQLVQLSKITETDVGENVQSVTRLFGDWSVKTKDQTDTLDGLFRLSQSTGAEVGQLADSMVQFGAPLRNLGLDFDFVASMFANFEKSGVNSTTLLSGMRLSVANLADPTDELAAKLKELGINAKDPEKALGDVFKQIKTLDDQAGKSLGMEVFGRRAGSDLVDAVKTGRFEI